MCADQVCNLNDEIVSQSADAGSDAGSDRAKFRNARDFSSQSEGFAALAAQFYPPKWLFKEIVARTPDGLEEGFRRGKRGSKLPIRALSINHSF